MKVRGLKSIMAAAAFLVSACAAEAVELTIYFNPTPMPYLKETMRDWEAKTGHSIKYLSASASSSDTIALYQQQLASGSPDVDLYQIDTIWPGLLGAHLLDIKPHLGDRVGIYTPPAIQNNTIDGKLVAAPMYLDSGLIYYRKDLLEKYGVPVPESWSELTGAARKIMKAEREAGNEKMWGLVFQGRSYEGLTCAALEWISSYGGGGIIDGDGKVTVNNPNAVMALKEAASWIGDITPEGALNYAEEEARGVFQSGDAVFMRNWVYCWALSQRDDSLIKDKVGVMPIPGGGDAGRPSGTLGGWSLAISKYSKNQEAALELLDYLTGPEGLKSFVLKGAYVPSIISLFDDPEVTARNPVARLEIFNNAVPRPSGVTGNKYNRVSSEFYNAVHSVLSKKATAEDALKNLEASLRRVGRGGW